uniref:(northern house mosquito) hypothetical protein n=1 Tax=Culex pipiens TaxID=7175 RepID=A0A8D8A1P6_CULPI
MWLRLCIFYSTSFYGSLFSPKFTSFFTAFRHKFTQSARLKSFFDLFIKLSSIRYNLHRNCRKETVLSGRAHRICIGTSTNYNAKGEDDDIVPSLCIAIYSPAIAYRQIFQLDGPRQGLFRRRRRRS